MPLAVTASREADERTQRSYVGVSEAAHLLGVSRVTIWRWIKAGRLSSSRLGHRTVRIQRAEVEGLLPHPSAAAAPGQLALSVDGGHCVLFYEADAYLESSVAEFLLPALQHDRGALVVATPAHRAGIAERLHASGIDVDAARADGRFAEHDAAETLAALTIDGQPDAARFDALLQRLMAPFGAAPRVFGEMVALLLADGNPAGALALEGLWNGLQRRRRFGLLCAYPMEQLAGDALAGVLDETCAAHGGVSPTEAYTALETPDARLREIVALQQKAASLEQALFAERTAHAEAQAALRVRDEFISIASHELRTPVSVLTAQAQLSLRRLERQGQLEPERVAAALEQVRHQADKLARLITQLLDVSRLEAGKLALEPHHVDVVEIVEQVVTTARSLTQQHTLSLIAPAALKSDVDPLRIEQVLSNLLDNAIKYSPDGGAIEVSLRLTEWHQIELSVRDHGLGIPEDKRGQIFERFSRAHDDGQRGMGLGLYVSKSIVELHGGRLWAEFPAGGGTRMVAELPRVMAPAAGGLPSMQLASD